MDKRSKTELEDFDPQLRPTLERSLEGIDRLLKATEQDVAQVPEPIFVQHILPILAERSKEQDVTIWQQVAGHALRPIDVVNPKNGEVLFHVPPLLRSVDKEFTGRGEDSAYEIIRTAEKKGNVLPAMRDKYLDNRLVKKMPRTPAKREDLQAWDRVLKHYGYKPLFDIDPPEPEQEKKQDDKLDFSGEYDDL